MKRRQFITGSLGIGTSAAVFCPFQGRAFARSSMVLGDISVDTISDGNLVLPKDFVFSNLNEEDLDPILMRHGIAGSELAPDCNLTLLRDGERTILFDVGSGPNFMPSAGKTLESLDVLEVEPDEITHVVFTHAHPDHLWGLLDDFGDLAFPEAEYLIGRKEWEYWSNPKTLAELPDSRKPFAVGAARNLATIDDKLVKFDAGDDVLPGVHATPTYGHTPGHMSFEIRSGNESLMIVGDAISNHHVSFEKPAWHSGNDQDPEQGAKTRRSLIDQMATDKMNVLGFHFPFPGIGRVEKTGTRFRFVPRHD